MDAVAKIEKPILHQSPAATTYASLIALLLRPRLGKHDTAILSYAFVRWNTLSTTLLWELTTADFDAFAQEIFG